MQTNLEEFDAEPDGNLQGLVFIQWFVRAMDEVQILTDKECIRRFGNYLVPDSPAEEWYMDTGKARFIAMFKTQFPGRWKIKKTQA